MSDVYTDGGSAWSNALAGGYDRYLEYVYRSMPIFRQLVDKHPVNVTNVGPTVTLSMQSEFAALATTPLTETADVSAVAPPDQSRITVTLNEYGNANVTTLRLRQLSLFEVDPAIAELLARNMYDSMDALVRAVYDGATHLIGYNGGTLKSDASGFATNAITATDVIDSKLVKAAVTKLRDRNVPSVDARGSYLAVVHPDVSYDIRSDQGWLNPHQYVDTSNIYNAEIGTYVGARFVESPRCTTATDGSTSQKEYHSYFLGPQAVVEATVEEPHTEIGPVTDHLNRFRTVGWRAHLGWAIYRQESIQLAKTASSIGGL